MGAHKTVGEAREYRLGNYTPVPEAGCWLWLGARGPDGYGRIKSHGVTVMLAHRFFYEQHRGQIPSGLIVRHKCDTPSCVNPDHLEIGTHQDNAIDRETRQRGGHARARHSLAADRRMTTTFTANPRRIPLKAIVKIAASMEAEDAP